MGTKIEKAKTIFNAVKEVGDTVLDAAGKIGETISKAKIQDDVLSSKVYGVCRFGDDGKVTTLCSIHEPDGKHSYHKTISICNDKIHRSTTQYFDTIPSQEELDSVKD